MRISRSDLLLAGGLIFILLATFRVFIEIPDLAPTPDLVLNSTLVGASMLLGVLAWRSHLMRYHRNAIRLESRYFHAAFWVGLGLVIISFGIIGAMLIPLSHETRIALSLIGTGVRYLGLGIMMAVLIRYGRATKGVWFESNHSART
jgi:hypothetical protein